MYCTKSAAETVHLGPDSYKINDRAVAKTIKAMAMAEAEAEAAKALEQLEAQEKKPPEEAFA